MARLHEQRRRGTYSACEEDRSVEVFVPRIRVSSREEVERYRYDGADQEEAKCTECQRVSLPSNTNLRHTITMGNCDKVKEVRIL